MASRKVNNFINGEWVAPSTDQYIDVIAPASGATIAQVANSGAQDVERAIAAAKAGLEAWQNLTVKARASIMFRAHHLIQEHTEELADLVVAENGKNRAEAIASIAKGNETVEWACSLPQLIQGKILEVSRGVMCADFRDPIGIVGCIVPFNFPIMVPMWSIPIALTCGNAVILKPSEKVPMTMSRVIELFIEAGVPPSIFQIVNGTVDVVNALCDSPDIAAVTFVGSSRVAQIVADRCHRTHKKVLALGGAKNHLVALPDCDVDMAARDIVASFAGCCGQRCMAASVLVCVGDCEQLIQRVAELTRPLERGQDAGQVGPVIDGLSKERVLKYINESEAQGAQVLVDGRSWADVADGFWVGPTVIVHNNREDRALHDEIFGPVLSIIKVDSREEAIAIENGNPYGNAACIYTTNGANAEWFQKRFRAGMIGVNIGIPVPREPFTFGGLYGTLSKFGDHDITGDGAMEFFTARRKVTTKWALPPPIAAHSSHRNEDKANFDGRM